MYLFQRSDVFIDTMKFMIPSVSVNRRTLVNTQYGRILVTLEFYSYYAKRDTKLVILGDEKVSEVVGSFLDVVKQTKLKSGSTEREKQIQDLRSIIVNFGKYIEPEEGNVYLQEMGSDSMLTKTTESLYLYPVYFTPFSGVFYTINNGTDKRTVNINSLRGSVYYHDNVIRDMKEYLSPIDHSGPVKYDEAREERILVDFLFSCDSLKYVCKESVIRMRNVILRKLGTGLVEEVGSYQVKAIILDIDTNIPKYLTSISDEYKLDDVAKSLIKMFRPRVDRTIIEIIRSEEELDYGRLLNVLGEIRNSIFHLKEFVRNDKFNYYDSPILYTIPSRWDKEILKSFKKTRWRNIERYEEGLCNFSLFMFPGKENFGNYMEELFPVISYGGFILIVCLTGDETAEKLYQGRILNHIFNDKGSGKRQDCATLSDIKPRLYNGASFNIKYTEKKTSIFNISVVFATKCFK